MREFKAGPQRLDARGSADLVVALRLRGRMCRRRGLSRSPAISGRNRPRHHKCDYKKITCNGIHFHPGNQRIFMTSAASIAAVPSRELYS